VPLGDFAGCPFVDQKNPTDFQKSQFCGKTSYSRFLN
jgi:hypothetical protein